MICSEDSHQREKLDHGILGSSVRLYVNIESLNLDYLTAVVELGLKPIYGGDAERRRARYRGGNRG